MGRNRRGLRKLSADLIYKASDETASQVVRLMLGFVGTAAFCLLSLASPDSGLLTSNEKLTVPGAGPVSFFGFMLLGPAILIALRIYLQIYVEHSARLDRIAQRMRVARAPTLVPLKHPLIRAFSGFTFYLLLPVTMLLFALKAAVFSVSGSVLLCVAIGVIASHVLLRVRKISWPTKALLSIGAAILAGGMMLGFGPAHRVFELSRVNLSDALLQRYNLSGAHLNGAKLTGADLGNANLTGANLSGANLTGANLTNAPLDSATLTDANLSDTNLSEAKLFSADLFDANLSGAKLDRAEMPEADLRGANLSNATLQGANLSKANLYGAKLDGAYLGGAKLDGAYLSGACGTGVGLMGLNLEPCR